MKITLFNDFHGTSVSLMLRKPTPSLRQMRKAKKTLCPYVGCQCSGDLGVRGHQNVKIEYQDYIDQSNRVRLFPVFRARDD